MMELEQWQAVENGVAAQLLADAPSAHLTHSSGS